MLKIVRYIYILPRAVIITFPILAELSHELMSFRCARYVVFLSLLKAPGRNIIIIPEALKSLIEQVALTKDELGWANTDIADARIPGFDFSGYVISAPKSSTFKAGDQVYGRTNVSVTFLLNPDHLLFCLCLRIAKLSLPFFAALHLEAHYNTLTIDPAFLACSSWKRTFLLCGHLWRVRSQTQEPHVGARRRGTH